MNMEKVSLEDLLEEASKRGYQHTKREVLINRIYDFPKKLKPFKVGVISDTHLGSEHQQITLLAETYRYFKKEGITQVFHCGDVVEGNGRLYKGQIYEMFLHGEEAMVDYTVKNYPKQEGITTYVIGGSHDYSFYKEGGADVLKQIADKRDDIKYLGISGATINIGKIKFYLMHPDGGVPYARSYRIQKTVENFPGGQKPNILLAGHLHITCELPCYRNVACFQLPCFQTQTQYLRAKGVSPDIGFLVLEITPDKNGIASFKTDWHLYYTPIIGDY